MVEVGSRGVSHTFGSADVEVPPSVVPAGQTATLALANSSELRGEQLGPVIGLDHVGFDLAGDVTVTFDISGLDEIARATVWPVRWSEEERDWLPANVLDANVTVKDDHLVLVTSDWSFWSWTANVGQAVGEVAGGRMDAPECVDEPMHAWVTSITEPDVDTNAVPLRTCVEPDRDEIVTWRVVNNRSFSMRLNHLDGDQSFAWTWAGDESLDYDRLVHEVARRLLDDEKSFLLPPLHEVAVGVGRPDQPGSTHIVMAGQVDLSTLLVDTITYVLEKISPSPLDDESGAIDMVVALVDTMMECGLETVTSTPTASELAAAAVDVAGRCATTLIEGPFADRVEAWARAGSPEERRWEVHRKLFQAARYFKVIEAGKLAFYASDQVQNLVVGEFAMGITGYGRAQQLGDWHATCTDPITDSNRLYRNLALQDQFQIDGRLLHEFPGWVDASRQALEPLGSCDTGHLQTLAGLLPTEWGHASTARNLAAQLRKQFQLPQVTITADTFATVPWETPIEQGQPPIESLLGPPTDEQINEFQTRMLIWPGVEVSFRTVDSDTLGAPDDPYLLKGVRITNADSGVVLPSGVTVGDTFQELFDAHPDATFVDRCARGVEIPSLGVTAHGSDRQDTPTLEEPIREIYTQNFHISC